MNNLRRIGINIVSGGAGYLFPMAVNIVLTPFILGELGEAAYGLQVLANVIIGYLIVADMGLDIPITQKIAEYHAKASDLQQGKFLTATLKIYFLIGFLGLLLLILLTQPLLRWLSIPPDIYIDAEIVFYLSALGFLGSIINMWGKAVFNGLHRYDISNGVSIFNSLFGSLFGILLIIKGYGIVGFFAARIMGFLISNITYILLVKKYIIKFNVVPLIDFEVWSFLKKQIGYGFMLRFSGMIFSRMDQTLISAWVGITAVTTYSIPILIATSLSGLIASIAQFAFPIFSGMSATSSKQALEVFFLRVTRFTVIISTMIFVPFVVLGDKFLALWINPALADKSRIVLSLLVSSFYINSCLNVSINSFIVGSGHLKFFTGYSIGRSLFLFVGFLLLIKPYGIEGAGIAYMAALLVDSAFVLFTMKKKLNLEITTTFVNLYFKPIGLGIALGGVLMFFRDWSSSWSRLILLVMLFEVFYILMANWIDVIKGEERRAVLLFLQKKGDRA